MSFYDSLIVCASCFFVVIISLHRTEAARMIELNCTKAGGIPFKLRRKKLRSNPKSLMEFFQFIATFYIDRCNPLINPTAPDSRIFSSWLFGKLYKVYMDLDEGEKGGNEGSHLDFQSR